MFKRFIIMTTTFEKKEDAKNLANTLLNERIASCIQIMPIESIYWWKNKIESTNEFLCIIKTRKSLYKKLVKKIKENHPYEIPEIISLNISDGEKKYLEWIYMETK